MRGNEQKVKKTLFLLVLIISFSYILTSVNSWTFYDRVGEITKYTYVKIVQLTLIGKSFAPFQYRVLQPFLVQFVFRHMAIPWRDDMGEILEKGLKTDEALTTLLTPSKSKIAKAFSTPEAFNREAVNYFRNVLVKLGVSPKYRFFFLLIAPTVNWYEHVRTLGSTTFRVLDTIFPGFSNVDVPGTYEYDIVNGAITSEFIYLVITMLFLFLILMEFVDYKYSIFGLIIFSLTLTLTFNVNAPESALALMLVTIGIYMIVKRMNAVWLGILIAIGSFARADQMLFLALLYAALNVLGTSNGKRAWTSSFILNAIPFAVMALLIFVIFPNTPDNYPLSNLIYNLTNPWAYVYVIVFFNVELLFLKDIFVKPFYRKTFLALVLFLLIDLIGGMVEEVRILMPAYVYLLPLCTMGIKDMLEGTAR